MCSAFNYSYSRGKKNAFILLCITLTACNSRSGESDNESDGVINCNFPLFNQQTAKHFVQDKENTSDYSRFYSQKYYVISQSSDQIYVSDSLKYKIIGSDNDLGLWLLVQGGVGGVNDFYGPFSYLQLIEEFGANEYMEKRLLNLKQVDIVE